MLLMICFLFIVNAAFIRAIAVNCADWPSTMSIWPLRCVCCGSIANTRCCVYLRTICNKTFRITGRTPYLEELSKARCLAFSLLERRQYWALWLLFRFMGQ